METWLIYLLASLFAGWTGLLVLGFAIKPRKLFMAGVSIFIAGIIVIPTVLMWNTDRSAENARTAEGSALVEAFNSKYNPDPNNPKYVIVTPVDKVEAYFVKRIPVNENGKVDLSAEPEQSLLIGTSWLEIQFADINTNTDQEE